MLNHHIVSITKKGEHVFTLVCLYVCCALVACAVAGARKGSERGFAPPWRFSRPKEGGRMLHHKDVERHNRSLLKCLQDASAENKNC